MSWQPRKGGIPMPETTSFTVEELAEFDRLTLLNSSPLQLERIRGRLALRHFIEKHGLAKCDEMWKAIKNAE